MRQRPIDANALEEILHAGLMESPHEDRAAWVHHRIEYMHFLDVIRQMPTIAPPHNDPLTLEELREMDGEPVWAELLSCTVGQKAGWALVYYSSHIDAACQRWTNWVLWYDEYGKTWTAYHSKPEENNNAET